MAAIRRNVIRHDEIDWIDIRVAAQKLRTATPILSAMIDAGKMLHWHAEEVDWVPRSTVMRLKRENALMNRVAKGLPLKDGAGRIIGPVGSGLTRPDEHQPVLPMTSGRGGKGWVG